MTCEFCYKLNGLIQVVATTYIDISLYVHLLFCDFKYRFGITLSLISRIPINKNHVHKVKRHCAIINNLLCYI